MSSIRARGESRRTGRVFRGRGSVVVAIVVAIVGGLVAVVPRAEQAEAASLPSGFTSTPVFTGLNLPTAMAFSPDGKVYVAEKSGVIKVFPNASSNNGVVFKDLSTRTFDFWDRGMLGLTVDPRMGNGTGHDFIYVLYATDAPPGQSPPVWNDDCPTPPGGLTDGCIVTNTLSRVPVNPNGTAGAEQILISNEWCQQFTTHSAGHLAFGPDGDLYVSGGDGGSYENADWGQFGGSLPNTPTPVNPCGDPPGGRGVANTSPTGRGGAMRSQSPRRPAGEPRVLSGAVLRLNPDTGAGVPGNPMYNASSPSANASRILAYGMRNPFRFTFRPNPSELWVADVGWGLFEEVNRITSLTPAKAPNFGWPCLEQDVHLSGYRDLDMCKALYNDTNDPPTDPYYAYAHGQAVGSRDTCDFANGTAITGDAFYTGNRYPSSYANALFFADDVRNCIYVMSAGSNGLPDPSTVRTFIDDSDNPAPVDLEVDPVSKDIFFVNIGGSVNRISYASSNRAPTASATATPTSGAAPLSVQLNGSASSDPDGDALTYSWDTDGNGSFGDATGKTPTVSYPVGGTYHPRLIVTDPGGLSNTSSALTITVTSTAGPVNTEAPAIGGTFQVGSTVLGGTGTWTGATPITYAQQWQRCTTSAGSSCTDIAGATTAAYTLQLADKGKHIRERVTATNAGGSASAASTLRGPVTVGTNAPPVPVIDTPAASVTWKSGDTVNFSGHATDPQDGTEPASRLSWDIILGHCTDLGCHTHPLATRDGVGSGMIAAPDHEAPSYIQFTLTATDASGATARTVRRIVPHTTKLSFATSPAGLPVAVGADQSSRTPFTQEWVVGSQVQLNAPLHQGSGSTRRTFVKWSDGGPATHTVIAPASNRTYTAIYSAAGGPPFGALDSVQPGPDVVRVSGWVIDPDSSAATSVHVYVDGRATVVPANTTRADVGASYASYGNGHGFNRVVSAPPGTHQVCVYGINIAGPPGNTTLGCRTVTIGGPPFGSLDRVAASAGALRVEGWALDPDTGRSDTVHVYVDGKPTVIRADRKRLDVGRLFPLYGDHAGYRVTINESAGLHQVCAYGINIAGPGANTTLGCRTVNVPRASAAVFHSSGSSGAPQRLPGAEFLPDLPGRARGAEVTKTAAAVRRAPPPVVATASEPARTVARAADVDHIVGFCSRFGI